MVIPWTLVSMLIIESNTFLIATSPKSTATNAEESVRVMNAMREKVES
jgi:hypothetical protein